MKYDDINIDDLPSPDELLQEQTVKASSTEDINVDDLPSPEELDNSFLQKTSKVLAPVGETLLDTGKAALSGSVMSGLDELTGAAGALLEKGASYIPGTGAYEMRQVEEKEGFPSQSMLDKYREYQQTTQKDLEASEERSPIASFLGYLGGGLATGKAIGALPGLGTGAVAPAGKSVMDIYKNQSALKAGAELLRRGGSTYKAAAPLMAAEAALSSKEGDITSLEGAEKLGKDVAGGMLFGVPAVLGLQGVQDVAAPLAKETSGKLTKSMSEFIEDTPLLRKAGLAFDYGEKGINPKSQKETLKTQLGTVGLSELDKTRTNELVQEILDADKRLGKAVGDSLDSAANKGVIVNVDKNVNKALTDAYELSQRYPGLADNTRAEQVIGEIARTDGKINPRQAKDMIDYLDAYIGKFSSATNRTPTENGVLQLLKNTRSSFSQTLTSAVPEYREAAERFNKFRTLVPETILSGDKDVATTGVRFSDYENKKEALFDAIKPLIQGATREGSKSSTNKDIKTSFVNTIKGLKQFEAEEAAKLAKGDISESVLKTKVDDIETKIKQFADDADLRGSIDSLDPQSGVQSSVLSSFFGLGNTGKSILYTAANKAGMLNKELKAFKKGVTPNNKVTNKLSNLSREVFNLPDNSLNNLALKLNQTEGLKRYGQSLQDALSSKDVTRRNQILFTIMQNPSARLLVDGETNNNEELMP